MFALGALAFAGCKLPDATPHGMRGFRSHGGIAPVVSDRSLLSEASSPGSISPCRGKFAGHGADVLARAHLHFSTFLAGTAPAFGWAFAP